MNPGILHVRAYFFAYIVQNYISLEFNFSYQVFFQKFLKTLIVLKNKETFYCPKSVNIP